MLAVRTEAGRKALSDARKAIDAYAAAKGLEIVLTPQTAHSRVDALILRNGVLSELMEVRVRYSGISLHQLEHGESLFFSKEKVEVGAKIANYMNVPFSLLVYLYDDEVLLKWPLVDMKGNIVCSLVEERKMMRVDINATRRRETSVLNFYLRDAERIPISQ